MNSTMSEYPTYISKFSNISPTNIFEIGAADGMDSVFLKNYYNINTNSVWCFEPDPNNFSTLSSLYPNFNLFNIAISNINGNGTLKKHIPTGDVSTLKKRINRYYLYSGGIDNNYIDIPITICRMDTFIDTHNISNIDICKIDTEGCSYEVLDGFGNKIDIVKSLHIEGELHGLYEDNILFPEIHNFLTVRGFTMINYAEAGWYNGENNICDSIWIRNDLLK